MAQRHNTDARAGCLTPTEVPMDLTGDRFWSQVDRFHRQQGPGEAGSDALQKVMRVRHSVIGSIYYPFPGH